MPRASALSSRANPPSLTFGPDEELIDVAANGNSAFSKLNVEGDVVPE
jgi:hypothetical protein